MAFDINSVLWLAILVPLIIYGWRAIAALLVGFDFTEPAGKAIAGIIG